MSRSGSIVLTWAGEDRTFRLGLQGLVDVQEETGASPYAVLARVQHGIPMIGDTLAVLRHGLIGGGMSPNDAGKLVKRWGEDRPHAEGLVVAASILLAALYGDADDPPGKSPGVEVEAATSSPPTGA